MDERHKLFTADDELRFKQAFAINFMASLEAVNYEDNCRRGWKGHRVHSVEDAQHMATKAWDEWVETIGLERE